MQISQKIGWALRSWKQKGNIMLPYRSTKLNLSDLLQSKIIVELNGAPVSGPPVETRPESSLGQVRNLTSTNLILRANFWFISSRKTKSMLRTYKKFPIPKTSRTRYKNRKALWPKGSYWGCSPILWLRCRGAALVKKNKKPQLLK